MKMPSSSTGKAKFRGPTSSKEYNREEFEKYSDLIELYRIAHENNSKLIDKNRVLLESNIALQRSIKTLENRLIALERHMESVSENSTWYTGTYSRMAFIEDMQVTFPSSTDEISNTQPRCELIKEYRYATIPLVHHLSKTHMTALDGSFVLPSDLKVKVSRTSTSGNVTESDVLNAFDGKDESYWVREVSYPLGSSITKEDAIVEIELPLKMVNDLNINTIQVNPYPENGVKVANVEVFYNNGWQQIVGFKQKELSVINNEDISPRRKWCFPNIQIEKVRITLEQSHFNERSGKKVFAIGLQEVGIYLSTFDSKGGIVLMPFDMTGVGTYRIEEVEPIFLNREAFSYSAANEDMLLNNIYSYELYEENSDKTLSPIQDSTIQTAKKIWVKMHLMPDPEPISNVNPCLTSIRLNFVKD